MTEEEKMRWFLLRASTVLGDRVQHLEDMFQDRFFTGLESLFFEKDDPLQTTDEEFEAIYEAMVQHLTPPVFVGVHKKFTGE